MNTKINENILTELFNDNLLRQNRFAQVVGMGLYRCAHLHDGRRYRADLAEPLHRIAGTRPRSPVHRLRNLGGLVRLVFRRDRRNDRRAPDDAARLPGLPRRHGWIRGNRYDGAELSGVARYLCDQRTGLSAFRLYVYRLDRLSRGQEPAEFRAGMVLVRLYGRSERIGSLLRRLCDGAYRRGPDVVEFARLRIGRRGAGIVGQ